MDNALACGLCKNVAATKVVIALLVYRFFEFLVSYMLKLYALELSGADLSLYCDQRRGYN